MKTFGLLLLFFSLSGIGAVRSFRLARGIRQEEALLRLIGQVRMQISCFHRPLGEIFAEAQGGVGSDFDRALREKGLCEALRECGESLDLSPAAERILTSFAGALGRSEAGEQIRLCEEEAGALAAVIAAERDALPGKRRISMTVSLAFAAMAVILFL